MSRAKVRASSVWSLPAGDTGTPCQAQGVLRRCLVLFARFPRHRRPFLSSTKKTVFDAAALRRFQRPKWPGKMRVINDRVDHFRTCGSRTKGSSCRRTRASGREARYPGSIRLAVIRLFERIPNMMFPFLSVLMPFILTEPAFNASQENILSVSEAFI